ncbi:MAG: NAD(P)-dependent alcohol dehydrogenase [Mycobacterium sp.]|nr:NAD(P)-dependent alcohol dehydrogenase [Mycobacterium sp.]
MPMGQMTAATQRSYGDPSRLTVTKVERPKPGPTDVLVEVRAAGISPGDRAMVTGIPYVNRLAASGPLRPRQPIPGFDCAGIVHSTGEEVTGFAAGDRVFGNGNGTLADFTVAPQEQLVSIPAGWTFAQAAAVPESGCVALQAVRDRGEIKPDHNVAIIGAGGGVGCFALQIAKAAGAHVTGVCGKRMLEEVRELGADDVIDYHVRSLADTGRSYDVIVDTAGATPLRHLRRALTKHGALVMVGTDHRHRVTGGLGRWLRAVLWSPLVSQRLRPFVARPLTGEDLEHLVRLMEAGQLRPCVDRTFPLADAAEAMHYLDHRASPGKVVVIP